MDTLFHHLRETAEARGVLNDAHALARFLREFTTTSKPQVSVNLGDGWTAKPVDVLEGISVLLGEDGFHVLSFDAVAHVLAARIQGEYASSQGWLATAPTLSDRIKAVYEVFVQVDEKRRIHFQANAPLDSWTKRLRARLEDRLAQPASGLTVAGETVDPVQAPGVRLDAPFTGNLRDYSFCATLAEVDALRKTSPGDPRRVLPLGNYRFDPLGVSQPTPMLYLPPNPKTGAKLEYQGALIVAPQNSGKTTLLVRWAVEANRAGYSVFLVDVKGNLFDKLRKAGLAGNIFHFSTEPGAPSDRINFLAPLGPPTDQLMSWRARQLAHAILPKEGWEEGEDLYFYQNRVVWLRSMIHALKLWEFYYPEKFKDRTADLADLVEMVLDPQDASARLRKMVRDEEERRVAPPQSTFGGIRPWIRRMALLFDKEEVPGGQRPSNETYQQYTQGIVTALESFAPGNYLASRVRDTGGDGRLFSIDLLGGAEQCTVVLTAREQELDDAVTVTSMTVKLLEQLLFSRAALADPRPILLLLDETRRIPAFRAGQYITFAREAKAGCVVVYQSLDQVKDDREVTEILENVGTQIYLGPVTGGTAKRFIDILPKRYRAAFSQSFSFKRSEGAARWEKREELIDAFNTNDLYRLPAGEWPAIVYIKELPCGKPFLTDMSGMRLAE